MRISNLEDFKGEKMKILRLVLLFMAAFVLVGCGASAAEPIVEYIRVAGNHPKTLDHLLVEGQNISGSKCPDWISQSGVEVTFSPDLDVPEGDYACEVTDNEESPTTLRVSVFQVEPIPEYQRTMTVILNEGESTLVFVGEESQIPLGNAYFEFSFLEDWMTYDIELGNKGGFITMNPPDETKGSFIALVFVKDYVNMSMTETIFLDVIVR